MTETIRIETMHTETGLTAALADFVAGLEFADLPADVVHEAKRALIDHVGVAAAAADHPSVDALLRVSNRLTGMGSHTVIGRAQTATMPYAALVNGFAAHLLDYDDTFNPGDTTVHGSAPVWPVVFTLAEARPVTGQEALTAFVAGFETECRLGRAAGDAHYEIGWHVTGTVGHVGAAAAGGSDPRVVARGVERGSGKCRHPGRRVEGRLRDRRQAVARGQGRDGRAAVSGDGLGGHHVVGRDRRGRKGFPRRDVTRSVAGQAARGSW